MSWYTRMVKTAWPNAPVVCPHCDAKIEVDVKQIDTPQNSGNGFGLPNKAVPGQKVETGECYSRCCNCKKFLSVSWANYGHGGAACHGTATEATIEEVRDAIRNGAILSPSFPDKGGSWDDMKFVADYDLEQGQQGKPKTVYEKPIRKRLRNVELNTLRSQPAPEESHQLQEAI
jgi:hypothetical protein